MKSYIKPTMNFIKLRIEEGIAGFGSVPEIQGMNKLIAIDEQIFSGNFVVFWMKILRK